MGALDFTEIASAHAGSRRDDFELFAGEVLTHLGFRVVEGPDRGADGGRDMVAEEDREGPGGFNVVRWLVSCKHKAHGGGSVKPEDDAYVRDRLGTHGCHGFMAFYSTLPSSGLSRILDRLRPDHYYLPLHRDAIETRLLASEAGRDLAARYMPKSFARWSQTRREGSGGSGRSAPAVTSSAAHDDEAGPGRSGASRLRFAVTNANHRRRCADLQVSETMPQGSTEASFDVVASLRFGTMEFDVGGLNAAVGLRRVLLHVSSADGRVADARLGEGGNQSPGVAARAGDVWEITDPDGGVLTRKALGRDALCRIETPSGRPGQARLELTAATSDVVCTFSSERAPKRATLKVMELFLKDALFQRVSEHLVLSETEMRGR